MPTLTVNGVRLYYEETGTGPETIVFAHGLLWSGRMFDAQVAALKDRYRCITMDLRGQGQSEVTPTGYDMDNLTEDAARLIQALGAAPCHFLGLSMGGFLALRLGARRPELVRSLLLLATAAEGEVAENVSGYKRLAWIARWFGLRVVAGKIMPIMFGQKFLTDPARAAEHGEWRRRLISANRVGLYHNTMGVISRRPVLDELSAIRVPALILVGDQDVATVPARSRLLHERIAGSRLEIIPGAGHILTVEEPAAVNQAILDFLSRLKT
jgi:pimeloyl-ACP methyl ester carboxylesterase